ncbi:MAG: hypothetical protein JW724_04630 [Candidatus Altiarchaeota archaeon]|nr:hypothetical protein [Candidatus Altiarchaeota archaeon]
MAEYGKATVLRVVPYEEVAEKMIKDVVASKETELYSNFAGARRGFADYTGFGYSRDCCDHSSPKYSEKFSETKIFELDMPDLLREGRTKQKG